MTIGEGDRIFIDTNVLIYASSLESPFHLKAINTLTKLNQFKVECWISFQVLREYLCTHTKTYHFKNPLSIATILKDIEFYCSIFQVAHESNHTFFELKRLIEKFPVGGKQIHDANIVATMLVYEIPTLFTFNLTDFKRYEPLIELFPIDEYV